MPWRRVSQPKPPPGLRGAIEVAQQRARPDARGSPCGVDVDGAHAGEVEHQTAFRDRVAGDVMAAAAHAEQHAVRRGEAHAGLNVGVSEAARDQRRAAIDGSVPDLARGGVGVIGGAEYAATDLKCECVDVGLAHLPHVLVQRKVC